jgi:hypothetical protein
MKKATATSHGNNRLLAGWSDEAVLGSGMAAVCGLEHQLPPPVYQAVAHSRVIIKA